ncbi:MAG: 50S ribosomal protein L7ae [Butyrivibrio sp.]|uniref:L7Ae/L30e/S12e/Gadd45 family ribosomal protein n=1 Tax=Butyrivibrio sp. NC2002 TaxID=1410610 RepID=UPI000561BE3D|nr:ribosomal L7Ae/L30e/S12e/Gadd45 family protein [Butyrivibrio sp. NC2002]MBE5860509.1 50S ribosomal protein L7ae [Butyrivibrio sp.]
MDEKIYSLLGLCQKAGKLVSGEFSVENAIKSGTALVVLISLDASENTKKKFHDKCDFYNVKVADFGSKEKLGHAIGKEVRTSVAVTDAGFAKSLCEKLELQL